MDYEYIEMNRALPREILDLWEPEVGDRILNKTALNYNKKKGREILDPVEFLSIEHFSASCEDRIKEWAIPLYRQEDLQNIYFSNERTEDFYSEWLSNYAREFGYNEMSSNDLTILWLVFVMRELYGKIWDDDIKKWIPDPISDRYGI
jgi:hypothetical protein